ncbi:MAG TPA: hypothetical protein VFK48_12670, partial [Usitatibacter sp.]|nr:hypothetical protein [Usitatibacter sp.]
MNPVVLLETQKRLLTSPGEPRPTDVDRDPDKVLVESCRNGDRAAFATLVTRYQQPIYNAAYRVLGNADDAADTAQAV